MGSTRWRLSVGAIAAMMAPATIGHAQEAATAPALTPTQVEAAEWVARASIADSKAKIASSSAETTKTALAPLAANAGTGKTELGEGAGRIEVAMLGSGALVAVAKKIAAANASGNFIVLADDETVNLGAKAQFDVESNLIEKRFDRIKDDAVSVCVAPTNNDKDKSHSEPRLLGPKGEGVAAVAAGPVGAAFAAAGAIASLVQSDVKVTAVTYQPESRIIAALVAGEMDAKAMMPGLMLAADAKDVTTRLDKLDTAEAAALKAAARCGGVAPAKRNPSQSAVLTDLAATSASLIGLRTKLYTPDATGRLPINDVALAATVAAEQAPDKKYKLLRIRVEDSGGSVIQTKNLLTTFGAPALAVTGGIVAGYTRSDPVTGVTEASGLFRCWAKARMLRSAHRRTLPFTECEAVAATPG